MLPENNLENYRSLIGRMARARWLDGDQRAMPDVWSLHFSERGKQRMQSFRVALRRAAPGLFNNPLPRVIPPLSAQETAVLLAEISPLLAELWPPDFTVGEQETMIGLMLYYAFKPELTDGE